MPPKRKANDLLSNDGFIKALSSNLPTMTRFMANKYLKTDERFASSEIRGWKEKRSENEAYGEAAVCYVQVMP